MMMMVVVVFLVKGTCAAGQEVYKKEDVYSRENVYTENEEVYMKEEKVFTGDVVNVVQEVLHHRVHDDCHVVLWTTVPSSPLFTAIQK